MSGEWWDGGAWGGSPELLALVATGVVLGHAAWCDARTARIPNRTLLLAGLVALSGGLAAGPGALADVLLGAALAGLPMLAVLLVRNLGMGDVKMGAVVGAAGGLVHPLVGPVAVMAMALAAAGVGVVTRRSRLVLGPVMWLSFVGTAVVAVAPFGGGRP